MNPEPVSALFAGPFALATLSAPDGPVFPALVAPDGQALAPRDAFGGDRLTSLHVLDRWETALPRLRALAAGTGLARTAVAELRVHAPVSPRQVYLGNQDFPHGTGGADDVIAMPLQCPTQRDGLGHIFDHGKPWNGRAAEQVVTSDGDLVTGIEHMAPHVAGRGVLPSTPSSRCTRSPSRTSGC